MKIGFSQIDITPIMGFMPGNFEAFYALGAHYSLCANAVAFSENENTVIIVSAEVLLFTNRSADYIRTKISEATGVPFDHIMVAATHTHTGPSLEKGFFKCPAEPEIANIVEKRIVEAGIHAFEDLKEAELSLGVTEDRRFCFCRDWVTTDGKNLTNPGYGRDDLSYTRTIPDYSINVIKVMHMDKVEGVIVNYANHPDTLHFKDRMKFSPDYPGYIRKELQEIYGNDVTVVFLNGACGDINDRDFKNQTDLASWRHPDANPPAGIGKGVAEKVSALMDTMTEGNCLSSLVAENKILTLKRRQILEDELKWANEVMKLAEEGYCRAQPWCTAKIYIEESVDLPETEAFEIMAIKLGNWALVALPGEIYTDLGRSIRDRSPFENTLIVGLANGYQGYVIPDDMRGNGSYEGRFSSGSTGEGAFDAVIEGAVELLNELVGK